MATHRAAALASFGPVHRRKAKGGGLNRAIVSRLALACGALCAAFAQAAEQVSVQAQRQGSAVAIRATATIQVPYPVIWQTLTDYGHLHEFIPGMIRSRIVERRGTTAIVEQVGEARFLLFRQPINVVVESVEFPPERIAVKVREGNLKQLDGAYHLDALDAERNLYRLRWTGVIEPDTRLPLFVTMPLMRSNIEDQFVGMINEIERRHERQGAAVPRKSTP
jgi:hypothetical protein